MGLDCSHDAFRGAYSAFNRFRQVVTKAAGGSFPPHEDKGLNHEYWYFDSDTVSEETHPGLFLFLRHSDCDGEISPEDCIRVANDLELLLPKIEEAGSGGGHIAIQGGFGAVARKFINGCREAARRNEPLEFY